ncbi:MAG TPA: SEC59/DGK1/VTE5 family protein [Candidatus Acidoferrum sp.]|nr:SEC59/DGK1/VTE5 family protein [Candidatus Acidoferrum sp.]
MFFEEIFLNVLLMLLCYTYVLVVIASSEKIGTILNISRKSARKFLHVMIGNLSFIIPFFTLTIFPALVAAPFIVVTFLASPYSPFKTFSERMKDLSDITEEGHQLGLVFYAISYTSLAVLFASKAYIIAAGILPMAYGDAAASIVGERFGKRKYRLVAQKSLEGSAAMFVFSFMSVAASMIFFSFLYHFALVDNIVAALAASAVATVVEAFSPMGFDNLTVPAVSVLVFLLYKGGI